MRIFQSFQLKAAGFVYSHTVATGQYRAVYLYFAFYEEDVHSGVRLVQVIAQLLSGLDFSDGEPCLLQQLGGSIPVGRYDERKLVLVQIGADVIILIGGRGIQFSGITQIWRNSTGSVSLPFISLW